MSLGPEAVTDDMRAEERAEERARRQVEVAVSGQKTVSPKKKKTVAPKKKKDVPPELEERQKRASARMLQLGVPPLQVRIHLLLLVVVCRPVIYVITYYTFPCTA